MTGIGFDVQGHRGARGLFPENSMPAFLAALRLGVTTLEMDVVVSADSTVVVSHDPTMSPVFCLDPDRRPIPESAQDRHRILEMPYRDVARYDCGSTPHPGFPDQRPVAVAKPRLVDVIRTAERYARTLGRPAPRYNIETKARPEWDDLLTPEPTTFTRLLYEAVEGEGVIRRSTLQSFDVRTLRVGRALDPDWTLALLADRDGPDLEAGIEELGFVPHLFSPHWAVVDERLVRAAGQRGVGVLPWTVNESTDMRRMRDLGTVGLITDYPDRAVTLVR